MQFKTLAAIISVALTLGVHAAPGSFDAGAGVGDLLKRSYSHGINMSKRAQGLIGKREPNRHRRLGKRCTAPKTNSPAQTDAPQSETPAPATTPNQPDPEPTFGPEPSPEPTPDTPPPTQGGDALDDLAQQFLDAHNSARAQHGASAMTWSNELADAAQRWANGCVFKHSGGTLGPYGENLASQTGSMTPAQGVKLWMDEAPDYNPNNPQPSHFTQVVWKGSNQLGCAIATCAPGTIFDSSYGSSSYMVCEYGPAGNVIGHFSENVQA